MSYVDDFLARAVRPPTKVARVVEGPPALAAQAETITHLRAVLTETAALMFSIIEDHDDPRESVRMYREWLLQADSDMVRPSFEHAAAYLRGLELYPGEIVGEH